jgi:hypothetical protein
LAFSESEQIELYYSAPGLFKVVDPPTISIESSGGSWTGTYTAKYTKLSSSKFILINKDTQEILETSPEILHDYSNEFSLTVFENYKFKTTLHFSNTYIVEWEVTDEEG